MSRTRSITTAVAVVAGALPSAAVAAPTVQAEYPCYTPGMSQHITGSGFTPGGLAEFELVIGAADSPEFAGGLSTPANAAGAIDIRAWTPDFELVDGVATLTAIDVTLRDQGAPADQFSSTLDLRATQWDVTVARWGGSPARGRPGRRSAITATGWVGTAGTTLYAHYLRRGRLLKTARVGTLEGPCGDLSGRIREFPFKRAKRGTYRVVFDTTRAFPNGDSSLVYRRVVVG